MVIGLHDSDKTGFPNLALMKLSAWHKVLVQDIASAERRAVALRDMGAEVFAQPYRDFENKIAPSPEQKRFARWVNHKFAREPHDGWDVWGDEVSGIEEWKP